VNYPTYAEAEDLPTPAGENEQNIGEVARGLQRVHDDMVARIGDVYVNLSATWTSPSGKLITLSYGTVEPDEGDEP